MSRRELFAMFVVAALLITTVSSISFESSGEISSESSDWTMMRGDSGNTGSQAATISGQDGTVQWSYSYGNSNYVTSTILVKGERVFVVAGGGYTSSSAEPTLYCYDRGTGEVVWKFSYDRGVGYETATGVIMDGYYYLPATNGNIYRIPLEGPGADNSDVRTLEIPMTRDHDLTGMTYATGAASMIYHDGLIYFGSSNGYVYCIDADLNVLWRTAIGGCVYYVTPTVVDQYLAVGALNGSLYLLDRSTGSMVDSVSVFTITKTSGGEERQYGSANTPVMVDGVLMLSFSDGQGMQSMTGGVAGYRIDGGKLVQVFKEQVGLPGTYVLPVKADGFSGVYYTMFDGLHRMSIDGEDELLRSVDGTFKAPLTLVNGDSIFAPQYDRGGNIYVFDLDGGIKASMVQPSDVAQFCMTPAVVVDGGFYLGTDGGAFSFKGAIPAPVEEGPAVINGWTVAGIVLLLTLIVSALYVLHIKRTSDIPVVPYIRMKLKGMSGFNNDRMSKVKKNKRRLLVVILIGLVMGFVFFVMSLALGPSGNYGFLETLSTLGSAIGKTISGQELSYDETIIFDSRCSRAVAAFAVGVGLSVSGAIYQAIIRNPMVDPYIMGVSAGAGVAAVATIAFNFTFFGLIQNITFVTPIVAMIGGVAAFGFTMLLAEKAGGSSLNYVLGGIIIGLVFSAIQTLMLSMAGDKLADSMSWLFGSFANISWTQAVLVAIPAIAMSLVPLVWAKELNLVLLGEDQARQMGLDVRRFNRWMLILASVLASVCVAFVGIVGFVGLVVPHLCRMILGGDHRLVLPASIVIGGALMLVADLFSKMVMVPLELPVGAITTVIGAPVFAYLLIKKGRMYDG